MVNDAAGTAAFSPPEVLNHQMGGYKPKPCDIWAMGVSIYCLMFDKLPFEKIPDDI